MISLWSVNSMSDFNFMLAVCLMALLFLNVQVLGESDVVILDTANFEHLTQASTGMTTGDWMVEFYAPWCGHCKHLAPVYEEVATALKGEVNVAKVDAAKERSIGSRFEIKGFPTILFLSHGNVYKFKGPRTKEGLVEFAKGGYKKMADQAEPIPEPVGPVGELFSVFTRAYKGGMRDIKNGNYMTPNVMTLALPLFMSILCLVLVCIPVDETPRRRKKKYTPKAQTGTAPVTSAAADEVPTSTQGDNEKTEKPKDE